jgi:hypothetical protein
MAGFYDKECRRPAPAARTVTIDDFSADYLMVKAMDTHKTPARIISELIRKEIASA